MTASENIEVEQVVESALRVAALQKRRLDDISRTQEADGARVEFSIETSEQLLLELGYELPSRGVSVDDLDSIPESVAEKSWEELVAEAQGVIKGPVSFESLLTPQEIALVCAKHDAIGSELGWFSSLDRYDVSIAVVSGLLAGLLDVFLVGVPAHSGFLGSKSAEGGWLSNLFKDKSTQILSADRIKKFERAYKVSFDPSTNSRLREKVAGLYPKTHRFHSLGHDPLLGFIFGVKDQLSGSFTAIDKTGHLITQQVAAPLLSGDNFFVAIAEALKTQFGHLASDVATKTGLPAPFMSLLMFLQFGKIGVKEHSVAEISRYMYEAGYDFRHFMAGTVPVMVTETIVRLGYFVRSISAGKNLADAVPSASNLSLRRQLLIAHAVATLVNAGKVYFSGSILSINWSQMLTLLRYAVPELSYMLHGQEAERSKLVQKQIMADYESIRSEAAKLLLKTPVITI